MSIQEIFENLPNGTHTFYDTVTIENYMVEKWTDISFTIKITAPNCFCFLITSEDEKYKFSCFVGDIHLEGDFDWESIEDLQLLN